MQNKVTSVIPVFVFNTLLFMITLPHREGNMDGNEQEGYVYDRDLSSSDREIVCILIDPSSYYIQDRVNLKPRPRRSMCTPHRAEERQAHRLFSITNSRDFCFCKAVEIIGDAEFLMRSQSQNLTQNCQCFKHIAVKDFSRSCTSRCSKTWLLEQWKFPR